VAPTSTALLKTLATDRSSSLLGLFATKFVRSFYFWLVALYFRKFPGHRAGHDADRPLACIPACRYAAPQSTATDLNCSKHLTATPPVLAAIFT